MQRWYLNLFVIFVKISILTKYEVQADVVNFTLPRSHGNITEDIFDNVLENITRVNNILQDLISNYAQLQKIYKNQNSFESDYGTDKEVKELLNGDQKRELSQKARDSTEEVTRSSIYITRMIMDTEETNEDISSNQKKIKTKNEDAEPDKEVINTQDEPKFKTHSRQDKDQAEEKTESSQNKKNKGRIMVIELLPNRTFVQSNIKAHIARLRSRDGDGDVKTNNESAKKGSLRYGPGVKQVVWSETFPSKSIWSDITNKKPIKLEPEKEMFYSKERYYINRDSFSNTQKDSYNNNQSVAVSNKGMDSKVPEPKPIDSQSDHQKKNRAEDFGSKKSPLHALVILKSKKRQEAEGKSEKSEEREVSQESDNSKEARELWEEVEQDRQKANTLRQGYGDACLKVGVRKCYLAAKKALKAECTDFKCHRDFKKSFIGNVKGHCLRLYMPSPKDSTQKGDKRTEKGQIISKFVDLTREGADFSACLPFVAPDGQKQVRRTQSDTSRPIERELNILRNRYEKLCAQAQMEKCREACQKSFDAACKSAKCMSEMQKKFSKNCKKSCKTFFPVPKGKNDSGDSGSGSSDSDSD